MKVRSYASSSLGPSGRPGAEAANLQQRGVTNYQPITDFEEVYTECERLFTEH